MSLDRLSSRLVEEGKEHPFVQAFLKELRERLNYRQMYAFSSAANGGEDRFIRSAGARAWELQELIELIENAKGTDK